METDRLSDQVLRAAPGDAPAPTTSKQHEPGSVDHWTPAVLRERGDYLRKLASAGKGEAAEVVREYPQHKVVLSYRSRDGEVEVHERFADTFLVLSGVGTLVTGGTVVGARTTGPGETRGDSISGGQARELHQGELVHVPAGTPHQFLVSGDHEITCLVLKNQEKQ